MSWFLQKALFIALLSATLARCSFAQDDEYNPTNSLYAGTNLFSKVVAAQFARWDLNHDGILSADEIDAAVADPKTTRQNAAAIAALKRAIRSPKGSQPQLTLENIQTMTSNRAPDLEKMFQEGWSRLASMTNRTLFAHGLPHLETVHQGKLGNCFSLAPLGAITHRDPHQVVSMISPLTNGDYSVKLGKQTVEVTSPTDAELAMSSFSDNDGLWVNVYEKAAGTARNNLRPPGERVASPLDALARGGSAGTMQAFISGHEIKRFSFKFAKTNDSAVDFTNNLVELRQKLTAATAENRLMTCGTLKPTTPGLTPNHAYAVFSYNSMTDSVELWNPHGQTHAIQGTPGLLNGYSTTNGVFWIPVPEFVKQFSGMSFEVADQNVAP